MVNLVDGKKLLVLFFENHLPFTFFSVETHLPIARPGCEKIMVVQHWDEN